MAKMIDKDGKEFDGYISWIQLPDGKIYKLQCEVIEVYPMICPRCGGHVELKYGSGACQSCGTSFTTQFKLVEGTSDLVGIEGVKEDS